MNSTAENWQCDGTPIKQRLRKSNLSQTEKKEKKVRNRRLSSCNVPLNFTTSPLVEKIKKKPLAQGVISPSLCFVRLQRQRLSEIGLKSNIILRSSQCDANDDTSSDITECDVSKPSVDIQTRRYVVHPRFLNDYSDLLENSNSDGETENLLNSTFTFSPNEENSRHVDEKGINIEDEPKAQDHPDGSIKRKTCLKSEDSIYNSLSEQNNVSCDSSVLVSSRNFDNVTLRSRKSRSTFVSVDDSSNDTDYHSPGKRRLTFDKSESNMKDVIEKNSNEDDAFASCHDNLMDADVISLAPNENGTLVHDDISEPAILVDRRLTFDMDDRKDVKDTSKIHTEQNLGMPMENDAIEFGDISEPVKVIDRRLTFDKDDRKAIKDPKQKLEIQFENDAIVLDDVSDPVEAIDPRLTSDKDDIKGIEDSNEVNSKKDNKMTLIQEALPPSGTLEQVRIRNVNFAIGNELKVPSIVKRMSTLKKPKKELGKLSSVSKTISRSSHLASFGRTPTISGSKALQLYEFLSDDTHKDNTKFSSPATVSQEPLVLGNTPPSGSSTPKILKKHVINSLLKSTLKKRSNNVSLSDGRNNTSMIQKSVKLGKMPNFASLHKKQFEKMENISDYKERKSERAKLLLSGNKPHNDTLLRPQNKKIVKTLLLDSVERNKLTEETRGDSNVLLPDILQSIYVDNKENVEELEIPNNEIIPKSKKKVTINISPETPQRKLTVMSVVKTPYKTNNNLERTADEVELQKNLDKINSPQKTNATANSNNNSKPLTNSRNLLSSYQSKSKVLVNNNNITRTRPANIAKPVPTTRNGGKEEPPATRVNSKSAVGGAKNKLGHTRFGFVVPVKLKKDDAIKAVCNKSRISNTNQKDEKRSIIKGVRSNRRFDLLMQMRNNK